MPVKRLSLKLRRRRSSDNPTDCGGFLRVGGGTEAQRNSSGGTNPNPKEANCDQYNYGECSPAQLIKPSTNPQEYKFTVTNAAAPAPATKSTASMSAVDDPPIPSEITVPCHLLKKDAHTPAAARTNGGLGGIACNTATKPTTADRKNSIEGGGDHASSSSSSKSSASSQSYKKPTVTYGQQEIVWSVTRRTLPRDCRATRHWLHELDTSSGSGSSCPEDEQDSIGNLSDEEMLAEVFNLPPPSRTATATNTNIAAAAKAKPPPPTYDECVQLGLFGAGVAQAQDQDQQQATKATAKSPLREEIDDIVASLSLSLAAPSSSSAAAAAAAADDSPPTGGSLYPQLGSMGSVGSK